MLITNFKHINKSALIGTFDLVIPKWGNFVIREMCYFQKGAQKWVSFPSKQYEKDGQKKYYPYNAFQDKATLDAFMHKVLEAVAKVAPQPAAQMPLFPELQEQESKDEGVPF
jgi:hypothetical protein